jgi:Ca-activated chloride channel homolog
MLHFLWLLPFVATGLILSGRLRTNRLNRIADPELLERITGKPRPGVRFFKGALVIGVLALLITALSGPRWGSHYQEVSQKGVDIILCVDVSPSMLASDVKPDRLQQAKREITDFIKVIQGDRVGLVAFSGDAFLECPLTLDYAALQMFLGQIEPGLIPVPGTNLGAAIDRAIEAFDYKTATDKVILLITDGEDNEGKGKEAAEKAKAKGVKIYVFGVGATEGAPVPESEGGGFAKDESGNMVLSKLDETGLKEIASITGGGYVRAATGDLDLDILYFAGIKTHTKASELKSGKIKVYEDRFTIFLAAAIILMLIERMLKERGKLPGFNKGK